MHRLLQAALRKNKLAYNPALTKILHEKVLKNFDENQASAAIAFVKANDIKGLDAVLTRFPELLMEADKQGITPPIAAIKLNRLDILQFLITKGFTFSTEGHERAYLRATTMSVEQRKKYIKEQDKAGLLPIDYAVASGDMEEVNLWMQAMQYENIDYYQLLKIAISCSHAHLLPMFMPKAVHNILPNIEIFTGLFTEENDKNNALINAILGLVAEEDKIAISRQVIFHFAYKGRQSAALTLLRRVKNAENMDGREKLLGGLSGQIIGETKKDRINRSAQEKIYPVLYIIIKAFAEEFSNNAVLAQLIFLKLIEQGLEDAAFYFFAELPKDVIATLANSKIDNKPFLLCLIESPLFTLSLTDFYHLLYLGADLKIKDNNGESIGMVIERRYELQAKLLWPEFSNYQPYFYNLFEFKNEMKSFFETKKIDQAKIEEKIANIKDAVKFNEKIASSHREHYANVCLNELWGLFQNKLN